MAARSYDRISTIVKVIAELLDLDENRVREYVVQTNTGKAILDKNQVVLHDQATANIYDALMELPESLTAGKWTIEDISDTYNKLEALRDDADDRNAFKRFSREEKAVLKKRQKEMKESLRKDRELRNGIKHIIANTRNHDS